ncbi:DUF456 family protein [Poriferisphaera sp. WC338]|uniref:DUF456 family protein n=1 Tax=Poriferisphaera sp. WC338 TaxID=3425129 RepID=UPI003D81902A
MIETTLIIIVLIGLVLVNSLGVVMVVFQLPGNWLMLAATAAVAIWKWNDATLGHISIWALVIMLVLAVIGEVLEFAAGMVGAQKAGASKRGTALALVMGIVGAIVGTFLIPIPIVGTLVGAALGSGIGAFGGDLWAGKTIGLAFQGGKGAAIGRLLGSVAKVVISVIMWVVALIAILIH